MQQIFFDNGQVILRTGIVGLCAYFTLLLLLRISGKRTLSKMNAFDLVVTVALGSTLATILLNKDVTLAQGALAFAMLIGLQFLITWTSVRMAWVRNIVTGEPSLLLFHGRYLSSALRRARVTQDEVRAAVRSAGIGRIESVDAVVLETDGSFSVVRANEEQTLSSLQGVQGADQANDRTVPRSDSRPSAAHAVTSATVPSR